MTRRGVLAAAWATAGLLASYGLLGAYAIAYLFPPRRQGRGQRVYIGQRAEFALGTARPFVDQRGRTLLVITSAVGIEAFDTRCPHLGCKVHWEPEKERFFCPCHSGVFDRAGTAIAGPPADAHQSLTRVPLEIDASSGNVFLPADA